MKAKIEFLQAIRKAVQLVLAALDEYIESLTAEFDKQGNEPL